MLPSEFLDQCVYKQCQDGDIAGLQAIADEINKRINRDICFVKKSTMDVGYIVSLHENPGDWPFHKQARMALAALDKEVNNATE